MKKILVVNVNWLGDVVFSAPVFKALKAKYPGAHIACLAVPRVREILECLPGVDEIIIYDEDDRANSFIGKIGLIATLRKKRFDAAFILHRSWTRAALVYGAGIPQRIGYDTKRRGIFLTHQIAEPKGSVHRSDYYAHLLESFGIPVGDRHCDLKVPLSLISEIHEMLSKKGVRIDETLVLIHPGGNWALKRWPKGHYAALISQLQKMPGRRVIIIGGPSELDLASGLLALLSEAPVVLTGALTIPQLLALMVHSKVLISGDSGPIHLASGVGTRTIVLFGPTLPEVTGCRGPGESVVLRRDVGCNRAACYHLACQDNICMQAINVEEVLEAVGKI